MPEAPWGSRAKLESLAASIRSSEQHVRGGAVNALANWVEKDKEIRDAALPLLQQVIDTAPDGWSLTAALRGMQSIVGVEAARDQWRQLLLRENAELVANVAMQVNDPLLSIELLDLLEDRKELNIQQAAMQSLSRMHVPDAFDPLVKRLANPQTQPWAIIALGELGDMRAGPHLKVFLHDHTDLWRDDHGPMVQVSDIAAQALRRMNYVAEHPVPAPSIKPPPLPRKRWKLVYKFVDHADPTLHKLAFIPLLLAVVQVPWVAVMILAQSIAGGPMAITFFVGVFGMIPAMIGLVIAAISVRRGYGKTLAGFVCLLTGSIGCVAGIIGLGWCALR